MSAPVGPTQGPLNNWRVLCFHSVKFFFSGVTSKVLGASLPKALEATNDLRHLPVPGKPELARPGVGIQRLFVRFRHVDVATVLEEKTGF